MASSTPASGKDDLLFNKIAGAVLGSLLVWQATGHIGGILYDPQDALEEPAYVIAIPEGGDDGEEAAPPDLGTLMASADAAAGERVARKCISCHTFVSGGGDGTGPNLYDVIGEPRAYQPGFNYSDAMRNAGGTWTYENLFEYLRNPRAAVPGTNMSFAGLPKPEDRADLLAYMITEDTDAPPLPEPVQPEPTAEEAAEGEAADPAADDAASDAPAEDPTAGESADPAPAEEPAAGE